MSCWTLKRIETNKSSAAKYLQSTLTKRLQAKDTSAHLCRRTKKQSLLILITKTDWLQSSCGTYLQHWSTQKRGAKQREPRIGNSTRLQITTISTTITDCCKPCGISSPAIEPLLSQHSREEKWLWKVSEWINSVNSHSDQNQERIQPVSLGGRFQ